MDAFDRLKGQLVATLRAHLAGAPAVGLPEAGLVLWDAFNAIAAARSYGLNGPNPIAWCEIEAWARLMRWPLEPHHVALIRALDEAWMEIALSRTAAAREGARTIPRSSGQPLTPALFDAAIGE